MCVLCDRMSETESERKFKYTLRFRLLCNALRCSYFSFVLVRKIHKIFSLYNLFDNIMCTLWLVLRCRWYPITWKHSQTLWKCGERKKTINVRNTAQYRWTSIERRTPNKCASSIPTDIKWGLSSDMPMVFFSVFVFLLLFYSNELISHLWAGWILWRQVFNCLWRCVWECDEIYTIPLEFSEQRVCFFSLEISEIFRAIRLWILCFRHFLRNV